MKNDPLRGLTKKQRSFVVEYVTNGNATAAYRKAYNAVKMDDKTCGNAASRLKLGSKVGAAIAALQKVAAEKITMDVAGVMAEWVDIATADPNELMSYQRRCCRYCYGRGHLYQWKDRDEFSFKVAGVMDHNGKCKKGKEEPLPNDLGGYGFNFTYRPHPECTQCRGEGHGITMIEDTRTLSAKGHKLYAGVKQTSHGIQILTRDQDAALANIAKALGMFTENVNLAVTGKNGGPVATVELPTDPVEAAKVYQQLMKGK